MTVFLQASNLSGIATLRHGFFTRQGGVSDGSFSSLNCSESSRDVPENVVENRRRVAQALGVDGDHLMICRQMHSACVRVITSPFYAQNRPEADAMVTDRCGIALGILTGDCVPILLADGKAGVIGAAHAGWRGALDGVIEQTVGAMERLGADCDNITAALGPCIWHDSYEVGPDFPIPFYINDEANSCFFKPSSKRGHSLFDLPGFVMAQLNRAGVQNVESSPADTYTDEARFYSHRRGFVRDVKEDARMLSCIVR